MLCRRFPPSLARHNRTILQGRHRPDTASSPTVGMIGNWLRCSSGNSQTTSFRRAKSGRSCARSIRSSPARSCFGGTTCIQARTTPSHRARCIPPMGARCSIFTPGPTRFAPGSKRIWVNFLSRLSGGRRRASIRRKVPRMRRRAGSPSRRNGSKTNISRRSAWFTCRILITVCSGLGRLLNPLLTPPRRGMSQAGRAVFPLPGRPDWKVRQTRWQESLRYGRSTPPFVATLSKSTPSSAT